MIILTLSKKFMYIYLHIDLHLSSQATLKKENYLCTVLSYLHNEYNNPTKCANYIVPLQRPYTDYPHHYPYYWEAIVHATLPICLHTWQHANFDFKKIVAILYTRCCSIYTMYGFEKNYCRRMFHLFIDWFLWW